MVVEVEVEVVVEVVGGSGGGGGGGGFYCAPGLKTLCASLMTLATSCT